MRSLSRRVIFFLFPQLAPRKGPFEMQRTIWFADGRKIVVYGGGGLGFDEPVMRMDTKLIPRPATNNR